MTYKKMIWKKFWSRNLKIILVLWCFSSVAALSLLLISQFNFLEKSPPANVSFWIALLFLTTLTYVGVCLARIEKVQVDIKALLEHFTKPTSLFVTEKVLPNYCYPDLYLFADSKMKNQMEWVLIESHHFETLPAILAGSFFAPQNRRINPSVIHTWPIGPGKTLPIPISFFLVRLATEIHDALIIRALLRHDTQEVILEVAASSNEVAGEWVEQFEKYRRESSIYKNQIVQFSVIQEKMPTLNFDGLPTLLSLQFVDKPPVRDEDIVLDVETNFVLERCVVDFHNRREVLLKYGLPGRRGIIFYGPPGTGKTYTCRYLAGKLRDSTNIVVTGQALAYPKYFCELARALQPAMVILEDVDLVYGSRDKIFNSTVLGDLMDELDGFGQTDHVIFILTTNAIDRVEDAIKDRPGRISQCVYFGQPGPELRRRYLVNLLKNYQSSQVDMPKLVKETDGVSQAFLKELVFRAVQISSGSNTPSCQEAVTILDENLMVALNEMKQTSGRSGASILGFRHS